MKPLGTLRLVLALCVLYGHSFRIIENQVPAWLQWSGAVAAQLGVLMFFTVSGYIICYTVERAYIGRPLAFLENRALRIYPVHIVCFLFALWVVHDVKNTPYGFVPMISREGMKGIDFFSGMAIFPGIYLSPNPPIWSVFVELQFYLFMGIATFFPQRRAAWWLAGMFVSICTITHANPIPWLIDFTFDTYGYFFSFFALGGSLFYLRSRWAWPLFGLSLAAVTSYNLTRQISAPLDIMALAYIGCLIVFCLLVTLQRSAGKADTFLGGLSYPLYACHVPMLALLAQDAHGWLQWATIDGICVAASIALYLAVERPMLSVRAAVRERAARRAGGLVEEARRAG